jgi:hypothetical protein
MKRFLLIFVLSFLVKFGFSQVYQVMAQYGYGPVKRFDVDSTLTIPTTCGVPTLRSTLTKKTAIAYDSCNNRFYIYNPKTLTWYQLSGGGGGSTDTTSLSNRINTKIDSLRRISDSIFAYANGTGYFQYKDSVGAGSDTASVVKATVTNAEATTLLKGEVVYLYGSTGNRASVKRAYNTSDTFSSKTFAIVKENIAANAIGTVISQGVVDKLNLGAFTSGDILWLDSIPGQYTNNKPSAPYHSVFIGIVERANNGNGQIYVKVQNGYELGELHNVSVNGQSDNDVLYYQLSTKLWKAKSPYSLVDTSKLSARIDLRMKYTDTVSLSNRINTKQNAGSYLTASDTTSLSNRINAKQNAGTYLTPSDTASLSNRINLKLNTSDTTSMLSTYQRSNTAIKTSDTSVFQRKNIGAYSFMANKTNASANATNQTFKDTSGTYTGSISWTGTTQPSGTTNHSYRWTQIGKLVTVNVSLVYGTAGSTLTAATMDLPSDCPTPSSPAGISGNSRILYYGSGNMTANGQIGTNASRAGLIINSASTGYSLTVAAASGNYNWASITVQYYTN